MVAEAAANPILNADLRSILFIALLLKLQQRAAAEAVRISRTMNMWCETEKRIGL